MDGQDLFAGCADEARHVSMCSSTSSRSQIVSCPHRAIAVVQKTRPSGAVTSGTSGSDPPAG
jgi:hypothetical protein